MVYVMSKQKNNRWYDQDPTLSKSVQLIDTFPSEIQSIVAEAIMQLAERECNIKELLDNLRSLGPDKVLGMYKSKNKRRRYDGNSSVHQALNYMFILSDNNRLFMAGKIIEIVNHIYDYLRICKTFRKLPDPDDIQAVVDAYLELGGLHATRLLHNIAQNLKEEVALAQVAPEDEALAVAEDTQGMKIREDRL